MKSKISKTEKRFLNEIWNNIHEISKYKDKTEKEKMEILAFSILVMIDGEHAFMSPFSLRPINDKGNEGKDIAGNLHDNFYRTVNK